MANQAGHYKRNERLQVQDKYSTVKKSLWQGRQNSASGTGACRFRTVFCCFIEYHYGKVGRTMHQAREVIGSRQYSAIKKSLWQGRQNTASGARG